MILHCIRHGESVFNAENRIQGQANPSLSPKGVLQSQALARGYEGVQVDAVYCSPLERAYTTAKPLADKLGLEIQPDDRLMELNAGIFQGLCWSEIQDRYPEEAARWKSHDPEYAIPEGESRLDLMRRGREAFDSIRLAGNETVVVVAHGGILAAAIKDLLRIPPALNPFQLYNGSVSKLSWHDRVQLLTLNETSHLLNIDGEISTKRGDLE